jgi:isochorismate synthase
VLIPRSTLDELARRLSAQGPGLRVAWVDTDLDPVDLVRSGAGAFASAFVYATPEGRAFGGLGTAWSATSAGPDRFRRIEARLGGLPEDAEVMVGFSFSPDGPHGEEWSGYPAASAVLPQAAVRRVEGRSRLIAALPAGGSPGVLLSLLGTLRRPEEPAVHHGADHRVRPVPTPDEWRDRVAETVAAIRSGLLDKVVLARALDLETGTPIEPFELVARLRSRYPESRIFGWAAGAAAFVGATPELLVARTGRRFHTTPLAGSVRRGADVDEDRRLADRLLASDKDRSEHAMVVDEIVARLQPISDTLDVPPGPVVERFATVQHLATRITGTGPAGLLGLVDALHPTPAVAGTPTADALAFIDKVEAVDRGWYAGGIGWADRNGDGEISLALRSALLQGGTARLFAGNGIVAGSSAEAELEETRLKLRPLLDLLIES